MKRSNLNIVTRLSGLVKPLSGYMVLAILMGLIGHLCATFITVLGGAAVLDLLGANQGAALTTIFILLGLFALVRGFLRYAEQGCNHFIAFKLLALLRDKVFTALRRLCPAKLDGRNKGDLISLITSDIELLEVFYAHTISPVCIATLFTIIMVCFIGSFHWALGLLALAAYLTVGVLIPVVTSKMSGDDGMQFRGRTGVLAGFVLDSLRGLPEIIQYGQGENRMEQMNRQSAALAGQESHMKQMTSWNTAITNFVILLFDMAMLFASASLGDFAGTLLPTLALMSSFGPVIALAALGATLQQTFAAGNRVLDILDETPVAEEVTGKPEVSFTGAKADHVSFAYADEKILDDFSLDIPKNKIVGVVGKSGSGKSTLLKLLMRFWQVQQGQMLVSGRSVEDINTTNLRQMESFVTQETYLFHDTIRNNLRVAKWNATDEELVEACKKASVHDFICKLPQGYDTQVDELGDSLSGGERQRLGLARAFLHEAQLMLLDEPTSNLDSLNEAVILRSLHQCCKDKTVVLVSHRQSTMGIADVVCTVEQGRNS